jgi:hypothetical protein
MKTVRFLPVLVVAAIAGAGVGWWVLRPSRPISTPSVAHPSADSVRTAAKAAGPPPHDPSPVAPRPTLRIAPDQLELTGPGDGGQLIVTRMLDDGVAEDVTRVCRFEITPAGAGEVSAAGFFVASQPGAVGVRAIHDGLDAGTTIEVGGEPLPVSDFALDIAPILTKAGCNSGACHGAAQGKGGLALSLFGYDPESDYRTLTRGLEGRRIDPFVPESSLLLLKPSLTIPHGGGARLRPDSADYARLRDWIVAGTPWRDESRGLLERISVEPTDQFLTAAPAEQQLRVVAEYAGGVRRDVTRHSVFVSNDAAAVSVGKRGLARLLRRGQADVVVRYANRITTTRLAAPFNDRIDVDYSTVPRRNFIDDRVVEQLAAMRLPASPRSGDAEFLRRVYFDLIGHMPGPALRVDDTAIRDFLADTDPDKRDKLIDRLLRHPDFVTFWSLKFGDLLQITTATMGTAANSYHLWLGNQLKLDKDGTSTSYAEMVRTLLLAKGSLKGGRPVAPAAYFAAPIEPGEIAEQVARRFMGIRMRCARCHDHPLDVWTQDDYYGFASFFGRLRVETEGQPLAQQVKLVEENAVKHLRTGETPPPKFLGGVQPEAPEDGDPRQLVVDWLLDADNPRFARMAANWVWAHLVGRGVVEPVDDLRDTNPPTNPALLDDLARNFQESGYDLRALIRTICQSETYQRTSTPIAGNEGDEQFYSHAPLKPLTAHQMADAIAQILQVPNGYGMNQAKDKRAIEISDPNVNDYLLDILGRCDRSGGCEVGAMARPVSLKLALHLIIGDTINHKFLRGDSLVSQMAAAAREAEPADAAKVRAAQMESIYLRVYCRPPTDAETQFWTETLAEYDDPAEGLEDMVWAVLNSREFTFNH